MDWLAEVPEIFEAGKIDEAMNIHMEVEDEITNGAAAMNKKVNGCKMMSKYDGRPR